MIRASCACVAPGGKICAGSLSNRARPDRVLLAGQEHRQRGGQRGGVVELGQRPGAVVHRGAGVDDERGAEVALFLVLLDVVAVGAAEDAPVEPAQVVAGRVFAILGELDVEAVERAAVQAARCVPSTTRRARSVRSAIRARTSGSEYLGDLAIDLGGSWADRDVVEQAGR